MNYVSASDKTNGWSVSVGSGLTKVGEPQTQISITRTLEEGKMLQIEGLTVDPHTWLALITVVDELRKFTEAQRIKPL